MGRSRGNGGREGVGWSGVGRGGKGRGVEYFHADWCMAASAGRLPWTTPRKAEPRSHSDKTKPHTVNGNMTHFLSNGIPATGVLFMANA